MGLPSNKNNLKNTITHIFCTNKQILVIVFFYIWFLKTLSINNNYNFIQLFNKFIMQLFLISSFHHVSWNVEMKCDHPQSCFILFKLTKKNSLFPKKIVVRGIWNHTKKATNFISLKKITLWHQKKNYILDKGGILLCIIKLFFLYLSW